MYVLGVQLEDGRVDREIAVHHLHMDNPLTPSQARQLALALLAAADEVETMDGYDRMSA